MQRTFRQLSYFDLRRRSHLSIQIARLTLGLPIALEDALRRERQVGDGDADDDDDAGRDGVGDPVSRRATAAQTALLNRQLYGLLRTIVTVLERMERLVEK